MLFNDDDPSFPKPLVVTEDHKPELPGEKARIEACPDPRAEVRMVAEDHYRIYLAGEDTPGLTMGRCLADFVLSPAITPDPEYERYDIPDGAQWWAIVASDGIWEFLMPETVHKSMAKKLRLKGPVETNKCIVEMGLKRWQTYEGDYCDDITSVLIQFNQMQKGRTTVERQINLTHVQSETITSGDYGGHYVVGSLDKKDAQSQDVPDETDVEGMSKQMPAGDED